MTLMNETTGAPVVTPKGWLVFVGTSGDSAGRVVWQGKQVVVCSPVTTECSPVPHPAGTVTVDPVWSPTGSTLAYAQASELADAGFPQVVVSNWYNAHQLDLYDPATGSVHAYPQVQGVTVPLWSNDGTSRLYVNNNGLWLDPTLAQPPMEIAQPLFLPAWPSYYGQVAFSSQFSWSPEPVSAPTGSG
ncbi:MAG: TolB-like translocation protein [Acidimicrobiales bacterium]